MITRLQVAALPVVIGFVVTEHICAGIRRRIFQLEAVLLHLGCKIHGEIFTGHIELKRIAAECLIAFVSDIQGVQSVAEIEDAIAVQVLVCADAVH